MAKMLRGQLTDEQLEKLEVRCIPHVCVLSQAIAPRMHPCVYGVAAWYRTPEFLYGTR